MTTFLLPQGKFRYLRAPMGLNASSDEWCCHSDIIIRGLPWARKIVDDTLIWATTEPELLKRARIVLQRCKENNITISQKKLELSNKIKFTGHIISDKGYGQDDKFTAIAKFPHPKNLRDLRGFIGLANQLGMFIPDLAHMTSPLHPLMKRDATVERKVRPTATAGDGQQQQWRQRPATDDKRDDKRGEGPVPPGRGQDKDSGFSGGDTRPGTRTRGHLEASETSSPDP